MDVKTYKELLCDFQVLNIQIWFVPVQCTSIYRLCLPVTPSYKSKWYFSFYLGW